MKRSHIALLMMAVLFACAQAPSSPPPSEPAKPPPEAESRKPRVILPDGIPVHVEIVADEEMRAQGLMYRDRLLPATGMIFLFPTDGEYSFWMKNTRIPLDMIWIDSGRRIVHVKHDVPPCEEDPCPSYEPGVKARYVLELAAGEALRHHLETGQTVKFDEIDGIEAR